MIWYGKSCGSGYMPNFFDYTIVYGGKRSKVFVFDPSSTLVAITDNVDDAEQLVLTTLRSGAALKKIKLDNKNETT